jgi:hypothetical protein
MFVPRQKRKMIFAPMRRLTMRKYVIILMCYFSTSLCVAQTDSIILTSTDSTKKITVENIGSHDDTLQNNNMAKVENASSTANKFATDDVSNRRNQIASTVGKALLGTATGAAALSLGAYIGMKAGEGSSGQNWVSGLIGYFFIGGLGYLFGEPLGVWTVGKINHENGSYWGAFAGNGLGVLAGTGVYLANRNHFHGWPIAVSIVLPISGSIVGYNVSKHRK